MFCAAKVQNFSDLHTLNFKNYGAINSVWISNNMRTGNNYLQCLLKLLGFILKCNLFTAKDNIRKQRTVLKHYKEFDSSDIGE